MDTLLAAAVEVDAQALVTAAAVLESGLAEESLRGMRMGIGNDGMEENRKTI